MSIYFFNLKYLVLAIWSAMCEAALDVDLFKSRSGKFGVEDSVDKLSEFLEEASCSLVGVDSVSRCVGILGKYYLLIVVC